MKGIKKDKRVISEFQKYYCPKRNMFATSMVFAFRNGQSRYSICLIGLRFEHDMLPKVLFNISNISSRSLEVINTNTINN